MNSKKFNRRSPFCPIHWSLAPLPCLRVGALHLEGEVRDGATLGHAAQGDDIHMRGEVLGQGVGGHASTSLHNHAWEVLLQGPGSSMQILWTSQRQRHVQRLDTPNENRLRDGTCSKKTRKLRNTGSSRKNALTKYSCIFQPTAQFSCPIISIPRSSVIIFSFSLGTTL